MVTLIIFEGVFALLDREIKLKFLDFKIFVHTDDDLRLARRVQRDTAERGHKIDGVLKSYHKLVKPSHSKFVKPTIKLADFIVPSGRAIEHARK